VRVSRLGAGEIDNLSGQNPACLSAESQQKIEGPQTTEDPFRSVSEGEFSEVRLDGALVSLHSLSPDPMAVSGYERLPSVII
jgi:hypothetical protein